MSTSDRGSTSGSHSVDPATADDGRTVAAGPDSDAQRRAVVDRQKDAYGGMKVGSAFFGWLAATGTAVLLTALVAAAGAAVGLGTGLEPQDAAQNPQAVGLGSGIALLVVLFVAYFAGGYVAGRMARFNGLKQGLGVWLWAVIIAVVVAVIGLVAGSRFDILARLNGFPRIPLNEGELTTAGIITAVALAVVSLVGALLGGLAGMRYHRKIDRAGFDPEPGQPR
jgi:FtsH-binding integral membrane protein